MAENRWWASPCSPEREEEDDQRVPATNCQLASENQKIGNSQMRRKTGSRWQLASQGYQSCICLGAPASWQMVAAIAIQKPTRHQETGRSHQPDTLDAACLLVSASCGWLISVFFRLALGEAVS